MFQLKGCIERYYPEGEEFRQGTLVVVAHLDDSGQKQSVFISRSTTLEYPNEDPVTGCIVEVEDGEGTTWELEEGEEGTYGGVAPDQFFQSGRQYRLVLLTPDGNSYLSEFETLHSAPAIDSLYWKREEVPAGEPGKLLDGIRFFLDFEMDIDTCRYLRWQVEETFEMHNPDYSETEVYDTDRRFKPIPPETANRICWITNLLPWIYTMDLGKVEGEIYRGMPLNFVANNTQRLEYGYSLLLHQYALSTSAYWYWEGMKNNLQSNGGLFDTQPSLSPGNIFNTEDEQEIVIGFFSVSGVSSARILVREVPGLNLIPDPDFCTPGALPFSWSRLSRAFLPYYIASLNLSEGNRIRGGVDLKCIDCRQYRNSTNKAPEFW